MTRVQRVLFVVKHCLSWLWW